MHLGCNEIEVMQYVYFADRMARNVGQSPRRMHWKSTLLISGVCGGSSVSSGACLFPVQKFGSVSTWRLIFQIWLDCHTAVLNVFIYYTFGRGVCVCVYVCVHDNMKTVADICFPLDSYVDWRKILKQGSHIKITDHGQGHFSDGSRSLSKVMSYSVNFCRG